MQPKVERKGISADMYCKARITISVHFELRMITYVSERILLQCMNGLNTPK